MSISLGTPTMPRSYVSVAPPVISTPVRNEEGAVFKKRLSDFTSPRRSSSQRSA